MPHVGQEMLALPVHPSSPPVLIGIRVARSLVSCVMFCRSLFVRFLLASVLSVRFTASAYPFGVLVNSSIFSTKDCYVSVQCIGQLGL